MTEYQKIAIGLLGLTHPEIHLSFRNQAEKQEQTRRPKHSRSPASAVVRAVKFGFAALVAGSRAVPLGDNSQLTRELGAYGDHLRRCG